MASRIWLGRLLVAFGLLGGFTSFWFTLAFTWNPDFAAVNLPDGPTHSNYHAFRGALLALAFNLLLFWAAVKAKTLRFESWAIVTFVAVFYYLGWWLVAGLADLGVSRAICWRGDEPRYRHRWRIARVTLHQATTYVNARAEQR